MISSDQVTAKRKTSKGSSVAYIGWKVDPGKLNVYSLKLMTRKSGDIGFGVESPSVNKLWVFNFKTGDKSSSNTTMEWYCPKIPKSGDMIHMFVKDGCI